MKPWKISYLSSAIQSWLRNAASAPARLTALNCVDPKSARRISYGIFSWAPKSVCSRAMSARSSIKSSTSVRGQHARHLTIAQSLGQIQQVMLHGAADDLFPIGPYWEYLDTQVGAKQAASCQ